MFVCCSSQIKYYGTVCENRAEIVKKNPTNHTLILYNFTGTDCSAFLTSSKKEQRKGEQEEVKRKERKKERKKVQKEGRGEVETDGK